MMAATHNVIVWQPQCIHNTLSEKLSLHSSRVINNDGAADEYTQYTAALTVVMFSEVCMEILKNNVLIIVTALSDFILALDVY